MGGNLKIKGPYHQLKDAQRFLYRVVLFDDGGCYSLLGNKRKGYRQIHLSGGRTVLAHHYAYELMIGPCPKGLEAHHTCKRSWCVNPWHLKWVTRQEHSDLHGGFSGNKLKTHCPQGHEYTSENTLKANANGRRCRICKQAQSQDLRRRRAEAEGRELGLANKRKQTCPRGHPYDEANTVLLKSGSRWCRTCNRMKERVTA